MPILARIPGESAGCESESVASFDGLLSHLLADSATGKLIPAFALTEPSAGSDASNQSTVAAVDGDHFVINGEKIFIMHGDVCSFAVTFAKIQADGDRDKVSAIIVPGDAPGLRKECLKQKMGMKYATTGRLWFENVRVPKANLLGEVGKGFRYAMQTLDRARIGIAAQSTGIAARALDESIKYAKSRIAFGRCWTTGMRPNSIFRQRRTEKAIPAGFCQW